MNSFHKRFLLSGLLAASTLFCMQGAMTKEFYKSNSVLEKDHWVKVGVDRTGVYEISYRALEEMGFSDPAKVSVYGRGGRVLPESFVDNFGNLALSDDLEAVAIVHENNKIYFYGLGPEEINFETSATYATGGFFNRKDNNIYSKRGYYFLTDSRPVKEMNVQDNKASDASPVIDRGVSYVYHETDSIQNTTLSGKLFWGEKIGLPSTPKRIWDVELRDAIAGKGVMQCEMYISDEEFVAGSMFNYGIEGTEGFHSEAFSTTRALNFTPFGQTVSEIDVPADASKVFVEFTGKMNGIPAFTNLDFWVLSYERGIPDFGGNSSSLPQQLMAFPALPGGTTGKIELANASALVAFDVTSPAEPERVTLTSKGGGNAELAIRRGNRTPVVVIFDKDVEQYQICGYETAYSQVANQNLHAYRDGGADFVIITVPKFRSFAEEIAQLHRDYDGMKVVVATTEECYNEFSGGVPDPMAYRSFAKMLSYGESKPKNMLLIGPLYCDFRGVQMEHDPLEGIIAFQTPTISIARGAYNLNDFYGILSDKYNDASCEKNEISIGVGIMPIRFDTEARILADKIKNYLERDDHAYYLNRFTGIGGTGDQHTHDIQVRDIYNHMRTLENNGTIFTPLAIDTYGKDEARRKFFNQLNSGCSMFSYFGHGSEMFIGQNEKERRFFGSGDVAKLRNTILPLALFGGCQITNSDRGFRGLGETIVTDTEYGCIGSIVSSRETWSGQNLEFFKQLFISLYKQGGKADSEHRHTAPTIGEVYASLKNYQTLSNEMAYQLLCDPALVIPIINRSFSVQPSGQGDNASPRPGDKFKIKGNVTFPNGNVDNTFNGTLVLRLNEPEKVLRAGNVITGEDPKNLEYTYRDEQVSMATAEVKNGAFEVEIHIPASLSSYTGTGRNPIFNFCAYDPSTRIGAATAVTYALTSAGSTPSAETSDKVAPMIERLAFEEGDCAIDLAVSDNVALNLSANPLAKGLYLYIDGKELTQAHFVEPVMEEGRSAYSKHVPLDVLAYGEHTARLKVKDLAGNFTESEIQFTYNPKRARYEIIRDEQSGPEMTRILVSGESVPGLAKVVILSPEGIDIWSGECEKDGSINWNHTDYSGNAVNPGHYKAYLIETGKGTLKGHADPIDIPVI